MNHTIQMLAVCALLTGCVPSEDTEETVPAEAFGRSGVFAEAYTALTRGERARAQHFVDAADRHAVAYPDNYYGPFYAGVLRLWQIAEGDLNPLDLLTAFDRVQAMVDNLEQAYALAPNDFRVTAFYGMSVALVAGTVGDEAMLAQGFEVLERAVSQQPAYGRFLRATAASVLPRDHPQFAYAVRDMLALMDDCRFETDGSGMGFVYPTDDEITRPRVCTNDGIVPHVWEGALLSFGDMAVKAGWEAEPARAIYRSAQTSPTYRDWAFASVLEQRIADVEERAARYADADPLNDPPVWAGDRNICAGCHQESPRTDAP